MSTIAAIATARGEGGIAIVRLSGGEAERILMAAFRPAGKRKKQSLESHRLYFGRLVDAQGRRVLPVHWSDNFFSLMPGETRRVSFDATSVDKALVPGLRVVQRVTKFRAP